MGGTDGSRLREQKKTPGERKLPSPTPLAAQNSLLFSVSVFFSHKFRVFDAFPVRVRLVRAVPDMSQPFNIPT